MDKGQIQPYLDFQYRLMHLQTVIEKKERRLMRIRQGHQILLRVFRLQTPSRWIKCDKNRRPNNLLNELIHLKALLNSERFQLYSSYYKTAMKIKAMIRDQSCRDKRIYLWIRSGVHRKIRVYKVRQHQVAAPKQKFLKQAYGELLGIMKWLETGVPPKPRRAMNRRSKLQREVFFSQIQDWKLHQITQSATSGISLARSDLPEKDKERINYYLSLLSGREREAYILHNGQGFSSGEIARLMHCEVGTVDKLLFRARRTIEFAQKNGPFQPSFF